MSDVTVAYIQRDSRTQRTVKASPEVMVCLCQFQSDQPVVLKVSCSIAFVFACVFLVGSVSNRAHVLDSAGRGEARRSESGLVLNFGQAYSF